MGDLVNIHLSQADRDDLSTLAENINHKLVGLQALTSLQKKFILNYCGNPIEAAIAAGYSAPKEAVKRLLSTPIIAKNIAIIDASLDKSMIADGVEVLAYWTDVMRDPNAPYRDRTKAAELLGKFRGLLAEQIIIDKHVKTETVSVSINVDANDPTATTQIDLGPNKLKRLDGA